MGKKEKAKKQNQIIIEDGKPVWPAMKNQIKGAIRRIFRLSPWMQLALQKARVEKTRVLKNGQISSRPDVYYQCAMCKNHFKRTEVQVDHIDPVIPAGKTIQDMSYDEIVERIFCRLDNLQVLCKSCHAKKTKLEKQGNKNKKQSKK